MHCPLILRANRISDEVNECFDLFFSRRDLRDCNINVELLTCCVVRNFPLGLCFFSVIIIFCIDRCTTGTRSAQRRIQVKLRRVMRIRGILEQVIDIVNPINDGSFRDSCEPFHQRHRWIVNFVDGCVFCFRRAACRGRMRRTRRGIRASGKNRNDRH